MVRRPVMSVVNHVFWCARELEDFAKALESTGKVLAVILDIIFRVCYFLFNTILPFPDCCLVPPTGRGVILGCRHPLRITRSFFHGCDKVSSATV